MAKKAVKKIAAKDADQYMLRLPPGMRDAVAKLAESNGRSINTEIIAAIEQHLKGPTRLDELSEFVEKYRKTIERVHEIIDWLEGDLYQDIERLQRQLGEVDERVRPERYDDMK